VIRVELRKQLRRPRTWVALAIVAILPAVITVAFALGGPPHRQGGRGAGLFDIATKSGVNMPLAALTGMQGFLLVIVTALFAGETLAGEAAWGSLRYLLVRPVGRGRVLTAKLLVAVLLTAVATVLIPVVGLASGVAAFGWHPVAELPFGTIAPGTAVLRLFEATGYVICQLAGMLAFAVLLSTLTTSAFGAVFGGVGFAVVSEILDAISAFGPFRYGLPTHYWQAWNGLFHFPTTTADMVRGTLLQIPYVVVFLGFAYWWFRRKDVLS
jgi:ABC-2 type transport system permease protein